MKSSDTLLKTNMNKQVNKYTNKSTQLLARLLCRAPVRILLDDLINNPNTWQISDHLISKSNIGERNDSIQIKVDNVIGEIFKREISLATATIIVNGTAVKLTECEHGIVDTYCGELIKTNMSPQPHSSKESNFDKLEEVVKQLRSKYD